MGREWRVTSDNGSGEVMVSCSRFMAAMNLAVAWCCCCTGKQAKVVVRGQGARSTLFRVPLAHQSASAGHGLKKLPVFLVKHYQQSCSHTIHKRPVVPSFSVFPTAQTDRDSGWGSGTPCMLLRQLQSMAILSVRLGLFFSVWSERYRGVRLRAEVERRARRNGCEG